MIFPLSDLRAGRDAAWSDVVGQLAGPLRTFVALRGANDVDGTLGEIFLDLARSIDRFEGDWSAFRTWAFTIARRRVIDDHRYFARRPTEPIDPERLGNGMWTGGDVETEAMSLLDDDWLVSLLGLLTPIQREVITLRFVFGMTTPEVAAITGISSTAVKANQRRAVAKLRRTVERPQAALEPTMDVVP